MRVLVTGHDGYIGGALLPLLTAAGHEVSGIDSMLFAENTFGAPAATVPMQRKDVRDVTPADFEGIDAVLHLAALSNDPLGNLNPDCTYDINHRASVHVATVAKAAGVERFLMSSSCSLYGAQGDAPLDESASFNPVTPYGESKVLSEQGISALADDSFSPTFLRNATAYGVSPRLRIDLVVNNLVAYAVTTGEVLMKSDGKPWRPLVHIEDISRAFVALLHAPREAVHLEAFNVGVTTENYRISDVAAIVEDVVPGSRVSFAADAGPDLRNYRVDCEKIRRRIPAFEPVWTVRAGVEELYKAYMDVGLELDDVIGPRFLRIRTIERLLAAGRIDDSLRWHVSTPEEVSHV